jgi:hypothetical protein
VPLNKEMDNASTLRSCDYRPCLSAFRRHVILGTGAAAYAADDVASAFPAASRCPADEDAAKCATSPADEDAARSATSPADEARISAAEDAASKESASGFQRRQIISDRDSAAPSPFEK